MAKIKIFKTLNEISPPAKFLLSFEDFIVNQHPSKGGFYRPEYAYYLDREITSARSIKAIEQYAKTGKYPYYLIPNGPQLGPLISQLQRKYSLYKFIPGQESEVKDGKFYRAGMTPYLIFDIRESKDSD